MHWIGRIVAWLGVEYMKDYRESRARTFDLIIRNNMHLNTVILTVSVASLTAIAALNDKVFAGHPGLSIAVVTLFVLTILLSTINFFLSGLALNDFQKNLNKDVFFLVRVSKGEYEQKYKPIQRALNVIVLSGFCLGLVVLITLLCFYIIGVARW